MEQVECRVTHTSEALHERIRANVHRAPMYMGHLAQGPRYCPSIEDKVVRFADKPSHHVFLEPESHESDWIYCNGIATSLPADVQDIVVHGLPGCERAEVLQWGYAVEYDMVKPHQIQATGETKSIAGLYFAGQINGTSGYEEAGGQGLIAGINAALRARAGGDASAHEPFELSRDRAYIGVLMDDLVTKTPVEPYRMFTSRAEYRLLLRADNAAERLTPMARELGLIDDERWSMHRVRRAAIERMDAAIEAGRIGGEPLAKVVKRPECSAADLARHVSVRVDARAYAEHAAEQSLVPPGVVETVLAERQYAGYIDRQRAEIKRHAKLERRRIPAELAYASVAGLRTEARVQLERFRPETLGQAGRLEGVNPADVTLLVVAMERIAAAKRARRSA
jgi:tRNA uridine 5-carboxymethylaminomethyl modification enzyme